MKGFWVNFHLVNKASESITVNPKLIQMFFPFLVRSEYDKLHDLEHGKSRAVFGG